jgi:hypothetical protein
MYTTLVILPSPKIVVTRLKSATPISSQLRPPTTSKRKVTMCKILLFIDDCYVTNRFCDKFIILPITAFSEKS